MPTVQGASVAQTAELRLEVPTGMTLDALWRRFVSPLAVLLTLAVDTYCPPVGVYVYSQEEERWLEVCRAKVYGLRPHRFSFGMFRHSLWYTSSRDDTIMLGLARPDKSLARGGRSGLGRRGTRCVAAGLYNASGPAVHVAWGEVAVVPGPGEAAVVCPV
jgi:hypothetical protein